MANFRSLGDLNREDSDDERDDTNDYYAGGEKRCARAPDKTTVLFLCEILTTPPLSLDRSCVFSLSQRSGMVVQGGEAGGNASNRAVVDDLFQSARRLGARDGNPDVSQNPPAGSPSTLVDGPRRDRLTLSPPPLPHLRTCAPPAPARRHLRPRMPSRGRLTPCRAARTSRRPAGLRSGVPRTPTPRTCTP